jgi:hypothetical protein
MDVGEHDAATRMLQPGPDGAAKGPCTPCNQGDPLLIHCHCASVLKKLSRIMPSKQRTEQPL